MWEKIKNNLNKVYKWFQENAVKILTVIVVHMILSYIFTLPYINLVNIAFGYIAFFVDWIIILILFKPKKEYILKFGLALFILSFPLAVFDAKWSVEMLGNISYLMIATYILFSLKEIRSK